jgi:hypothetical protein
MTGAWFRKTIASLAVTFGVFVLCMAGFAQLVRPHYMAPVTVTASMGPGALAHRIPDDAWVLRRAIVSKDGHAFDSFDIQNMPSQCQQIIQNAQVSDHGHTVAVKTGGGDPLDDCLNNAGFHQIAKYQPGYRYWDFQRIEAGIYLGMTALAVGVTYWFVLRRDA